MKTSRDEHMTILGCAGFIGSHLLRRLLATTPYHIDGVDLAEARITDLITSERFTFHHADVADINVLEPLLARSATVISLAALCNPYLYTNSPVAVIESNFNKMYPVIEACSRFGCRLIHFSTSEVYGKTVHSLNLSDKPQSESAWELHEDTSALLLGPVQAQRWCYAAAKQLLERTIVAYGFEKKLRYTIVRPFNFIGPGMDYLPGVDGEGVPRVFACFMDALMHSGTLKLVDGGYNRRCYTDIDDAVDAVMALLAEPRNADGQVFNVGNPANELSVGELAAAMIRIYCEMVPERTVASCRTEVVTAASFYGEGYEDSDRRIPSIDKMRQRFGWTPKSGIEQTLRKAVAGFLKQYRNLPDQHLTAV